LAHIDSCRKYPGPEAVLEIGNAKNLAYLYRVSKATARLWLKKAGHRQAPATCQYCRRVIGSGIKQHERACQRHPGQATLLRQRKAGMTYVNIAKLYGVSPRLVAEWCRDIDVKLGLPHHRSLERPNGQWLREVRRNGATYQVIGELCGVSKQTAMRWVKEAQEK